MIENTANVLLIEDDPRDAKNVQELAKNSTQVALNILHASSLAEGLRTIEAKKIDAILLDLDLPDSLESETFAKIHSSAPTIPTIILAGLDDQSSATSFLKAGAQDFLIKGQLDSELLIRAINYSIERQRADNRYRTLFEELQVGLLILNSSNEITNANLAMAQMFGYENPHDLMGENIAKVLADFSNPEEFHKSLNEGEHLEHFELRLVKKDGGISTLRTSVDIKYDHENEIKRIEGVFVDVSGQRRDQSELERKLIELTAVHMISALGLETLDENELIAGVTELLSKTFFPDHCGVLLFDKDKKVLQPHASYSGLVQEDRDMQFKIGTGVVGNVALNSRPIRVDNTDYYKGYIPPKGNPHRSELCVPVGVNGEVIGVLNVEKKEANAFNEEDENLLVTVAGQLSITIERLRLFDQERQQRIEAEAQREASRMLTEAIEVEVILDHIFSNLEKVVPFTSAAIHLLKGEMVEIVAGKGFDLSRKVIGHTYTKNNQLLQDLLRSQDPIIIPNTQEDSRFIGFGDQTQTLGWIGVPLINSGEVIGILTLDHEEEDIYTEEDANRALTFANNAAAIIQKARLFEALQRSNNDLEVAYDSTLEGWAQMLELRDQETKGHSQRVTEQAVLLSQALGVHGEELVYLRRGALLHDIGKMGIPDSILQKPDDLSEDEWVEMRKHPIYAYKALSGIEFLLPSLDIPYCHHENWDGSGYPRGLKGEEIPLAARIFSVVDVWDALSSDRPYRKSWSKKKMITYFDQQKGKQFDPNIVDAFIQLLGPKDSKEH